MALDIRGVSCPGGLSKRLRNDFGVSGLSELLRGREVAAIKKSGFASVALDRAMDAQMLLVVESLEVPSALLLLLHVVANYGRKDSQDAQSLSNCPKALLNCEPEPYPLCCQGDAPDFGMGAKRATTSA